MSWYRDQKARHEAAQRAKAADEGRLVPEPEDAERAAEFDAKHAARREKFAERKAGMVKQRDTTGAEKDNVRPSPHEADAPSDIAGAPDQAPSHVEQPVEDSLPAVNADVAAQAAKLKKRVKDSLTQNLTDGETIEVVIRGAHGQAIVGTGTRVFVLKPGFMAGASFGAEVTSWSYRTLAGIQVHKGMMSGAVVIQAPGQTGVNTSYWGNSKDDPTKAPNAIPVAGDWDSVQDGVARLRALIDAAHAPEPNKANTNGASMAAELASLVELRTAGHLSEEEFSAAKQRLLAS
jgi:hypothetical protein